MFRRVGPGNFTPSPSQIPDLILSHHPARVIARRLPPSAEISGSSRGDPLGQHLRSPFRLKWLSRLRGFGEMSTERGPSLLGKHCANTLWIRNTVDICALY